MTSVRWISLTSWPVEPCPKRILEKSRDDVNHHLIIRFFKDLHLPFREMSNGDFPTSCVRFFLQNHFLFISTPVFLEGIFLFFFFSGKLVHQHSTRFNFIFCFQFNLSYDTCLFRLTDKNNASAVLVFTLTIFLLVGFYDFFNFNTSLWMLT
jgi:hypothetical protein